MSPGAQQERILSSLRPFLEAITALGPLMSDPEACDFVAGNPEVPALPGYVETLQRWLEPQDRRWFAYGIPDRRATEAAAAALTDELDIPFEPEDIVLTPGAHGALALAMSLVLDRDDE